MAPMILDEVAAEYERQLTIPKGANQKPQFALCVIGLVGAGKTTVLKRLCAYIPMVRISGDEIRELLRRKKLPYQDSNNVISVGHKIAGRLKESGYNVAHDNDFSNPIAREALRTNNQTHGIYEVWIRVRPPEDWILEKLRRRPPTGTLANAKAAIDCYQARKTLQLQNPWIEKLPFIYEFDPSKPNFDEQIQEGVWRIRNVLDKL